MRVVIHALTAMALAMWLSACSDTTSHSRAVYMLIDTSGTYTQEIRKANSIINYLLGNLGPGDSLAVAKIDSGSFSEKDIVAKVTFDSRPSYTNAQKRAFRLKIDEFIKSVKSSGHTDITGGVLQAIEFLNETGAGKRMILIFSDLKEDLRKGQVRNFPIEMKGIEVVAINVTKLRSDNIDPREYMKRLEYWKKRVMAGNGSWRVINDLDNMERLLSGE